MIFLTVGSQKFQFNRLLKEIDMLVMKKIIHKDEIFAQIGYSTYLPKTYMYKKFLDGHEFLNAINTCEIVITHGGTGSIITSIKMGKKVIGVPRNVHFDEHVDNHQYQIVTQFMNSNLIYAVTDTNELANAIHKVKEMSFREYKSNTLNFITLIEKFLDR